MTTWIEELLRLSPHIIVVISCRLCIIMKNQWYLLYWLMQHMIIILLAEVVYNYCSVVVSCSHWKYTIYTIYYYENYLCCWLLQQHQVYYSSLKYCRQDLYCCIQWYSANSPAYTRQTFIGSPPGSWTRNSLSETRTDERRVGDSTSTPAPWIERLEDASWQDPRAAMQ